MDAIAIAIISAAVGLISWVAQRVYERQANEHLRREELYKTLLEASVEMLGTGDAAPFVVESQRAWVYASDDVLRCINDYQIAYTEFARIHAHRRNNQAHQSEVDIAFGKAKAAEGDLRLSIRKDLQGDRTKIDANWVKDQWRIMVSRPERIRAYLGRIDPSSDRARRVRRSVPESNKNAGGHQ